MAAAFQLPLQSLFPGQDSVDESKKLGRGIAWSASAAEIQVPAPLPLPAKFALPPPDWNPHPLAFLSSPLPPTQGALEPQISDRDELEVHTVVLEGPQLKTARIGEPDPLTWLPPPPPQVSDRAEDEEPIWKCAKRGKVSCIHLAVLECPQLKTAANQKRDPFTCLLPPQPPPAICDGRVNEVTTSAATMSVADLDKEGNASTATTPVYSFGDECIYVPATVLATISGANSTSACKEKSHRVSQSNAHSASPGSCEDCTNSYARNLQESYTSSRAIGLAAANDEGRCWAHLC